MLFRLACFLVLVSLFIPRLTFSGVWVGLEDLTILVLGSLAVLVKTQRMTHLTKPLLPIVIFVSIFAFVGTAQTLSYTGNLSVPTELWQYVKRGIAFLMFAYVGEFSREQSVKRIGFLFVLVLLGYQAIGFLQIVGGQFGDQISGMYARTDQQLRLATQSTNNRIFGVSGHSNSWGAFSAFSLFAIYGVLSFLRNVRYVKSVSYYLLLTIGVVLCLVNVYYSRSRGSMLAISFSILYFLFVLVSYKPARVAIYVPFSFLAVAFLYWFVSENIAVFDFIIYRFEVLIEKSGGGRVDQILSAIRLLELPHEYIFGVSNRVQRFFAVSHGVEVEFVNILVSYGALGFFLLYFQLFLLFILFRGKPKLDGSGLSSLKVSARAMILMYVIFSFGYFFYAELIVGVMPWAFFGLVYGVLKRVDRSDVKALQYSC